MPGPAEYPPEVKGERMRRIPFPVRRPGRAPARTAQDRDGKPYDVRASLGLPPADADEDFGVKWTPWPA